MRSKTGRSTPPPSPRPVPPSRLNSAPASLSLRRRRGSGSVPHPPCLCRSALLRGSAPHSSPAPPRGPPPRETVLHQPLQPGSFPRAAVPHRLLQRGSLPQGAALQPQPAPARALPQSPGHPGGHPPPCSGVGSSLPGLQVGICSPAPRRGLGGDSLPHRGLPQRLQLGICSTVDLGGLGGDSLPPHRRLQVHPLLPSFLTDLGIYTGVSLTSLSAEGFPS